MPSGLKQFQEAEAPHFITFSYFHRLPLLEAAGARENRRGDTGIFVQAEEWPARSSQRKERDERGRVCARPPFARKKRRMGHPGPCDTTEAVPVEGFVGLRG